MLHSKKETDTNTVRSCSLSPQLTCLLTGQVLIVADVGMPPWVVTPVCDALVLPHPDQPVGTVVQFRFTKLTLPVAVAVLHVPHHLGFCQAGVVLEHLIVLSRGWDAARFKFGQHFEAAARGGSHSLCVNSLLLDHVCMQ